MTRKNRTGYRRRRRGERLFYVVDFWFMNGDGVWQRYRRDAEIQSEAGARAEANRRRMLAMETGSPYGTEKAAEAAVPTLEEFSKTFARTFLETDYTPATAERYRVLCKQLCKVFGDKPLNCIDLLAWKEFEASLKKRKRRRADGRTLVGVKVRPFAAFMRTILKAAVALKVLRPDQVTDIPLPPKPDKLPDAPTEDDLAAWLAVRPVSWITVAVALAAFLGVRMGEVRELRRSDFDMDLGVVRIRRAMSAGEVSTTKGKKERQVPLHPSLRQMLAPLLERLGRDDLLVRNRAGKQPSRAAVLTAFKALCRKAGTKEWSFHSLRHLFVTRLLRRGGSAIAVQMLAGHTKLETTERYAHGATAQQRRDTILLLPPLPLPGTVDAVGNGEETAHGSEGSETPPAR